MTCHKWRERLCLFARFKALTPGGPPPECRRETTMNQPAEPVGREQKESTDIWAASRNNCYYN